MEAPQTALKTKTKTKNRSPIWPTLGALPQNSKSTNQTELNIDVHYNTVHKLCTQTRYLSIWYMNTGSFFSTIKKNAIILCAERWMQPEIVKLSVLRRQNSLIIY